MNSVVGNCPKCGAPIYSPSMWMGVTPPVSYSCFCNPVVRFPVASDTIIITDSSNQTSIGISNIGDESYQFYISKIDRLEKMIEVLTQALELYANKASWHNKVERILFNEILSEDIEWLNDQACGGKTAYYYDNDICKACVHANIRNGTLIKEKK